MAYDSRVYRVLIASPSDVEEEREIVVKTIQEWNDLYSYSRKVVLLPLRWETHTAPEYGTRPQEIINRAIVDQCDLLVGIFWTRIGSPTGAAESGTLEEIERVGEAGKPIMLYFSKVEIDPDRIEIAQIERLKEFKEKTYPRALVEGYRKISEFRDKFSKQLELKVRELQRNDASGEQPISLQFLSIETAEPAGSVITCNVEHQQIADLGEIVAAGSKKLAESVSEVVKRNASLPVALGIANVSPSGIRNLFIQIAITAESVAAEISDAQFSRTRSGSIFRYALDWSVFDVDAPDHLDELMNSFEGKLARFDADKLQRSGGGWTMSFEWEALQPQRTRVIKPLLHVYSPASTKISISAKSFADSFPEPISLGATLNLVVKQRPVSLSHALPNWRELVEAEDDKKKVSNVDEVEGAQEKEA